jgi:hypothetical protein
VGTEHTQVAVFSAVSSHSPYGHNYLPNAWNSSSLQLRPQNLEESPKETRCVQGSTGRCKTIQLMPVFSTKNPLTQPQFPLNYSHLTIQPMARFLLSIYTTGTKTRKQK